MRFSGPLNIALTPNASSGLRSRHLQRAVLWIGTSAPALALVAVALASLAYFFQFLRPISVPVDTYLPIDPGDASPLLAALSAIGLGALAIGLLRAKSVAWALAIATLAGTVVAQMGALQHPLGMIIAVGLLAVLVADRRRYEVETNPSWRRLSVALLLVGGVAIGIETSLIIASTGQWPRPLGILGDATSTLGDALGISDDLAGSVLSVTSHNTLFALLILAARLPFVLAALGVLTRVPEPPPDPTTRERSRSIARHYGYGALLPFQLGDDKLVYTAPGAEGLVVYGLAGGTAVVLGDLIGPAETAPGVLSEFLARCHKLDRLPVVYQASPAGRRLLLDAGFRLFRVGSEAIVDLTTFDLTGPRRANLRHTVTRSRKAGVVIRWFRAGLDESAGPELLAEIQAIDRQWQKKMGPSMGFTISRFDLAALRRRPIAVAVDPDGHALGYASFMPTGNDGGWVLDLMRRAPGSPPGVVEACIAEAAAALRAEGAPTLSLGLAPLAKLDGADTFEERLLAGGARLVSRWYDIAGLAFFKDKFDPTWIPRYGATRRRRDLIAFGVALLQLHIRPSLRSDRRAAEADPQALSAAR
jgi:phosphatidylglycerol lysyltransferase